MARTHAVTVRLTEEEFEWIRRKGHWDNSAISQILRQHIHNLVRDEGYLRPPDDEPQDFGFEKEMIQFVLHVQNVGERD